MSEKVCFPIRFGRSRCRVTIYDRTTALPYYRICYRLGAIRHQRTFNTIDEAISHAESVSEGDQRFSRGDNCVICVEICE